MFNCCICNEAWRQLFTGHILIFTLWAIIVDLFLVDFLYHCWILVNWFLSSLQLQHLITTNTSEKLISVLPLLNRWDRCSLTAKPGWGSSVNFCKRLSSNPPCSEYRGISACSLPAEPQVALKGRQELAPQGMSINDWAVMGGKEYEVVPHVAAIAQWQTFIRLGRVYIQSHDLIHVREVPQN